jgi:hypothetical protein
MTWTPPDAPDPSEILDSATADARMGAYADALAKFVWFHHNALRYEESLSAVRLSFALCYWLKLAKAYSPARAAFLRTRDETEAAFASDPCFDLFHDLAALNRYLGDGLRTVDVFMNIARQNHSVAERLYHVAEPFLLAAGRYAECGPFLKPSERLSLARESYRATSEFEASIPAGDIEPPKLARTFYSQEVATLVGLLALNRRADEAARARDEALTILDDEESRSLLDAAMSGHLPASLWG